MQNGRMKTPRCLGYATLGGRLIGGAYLGFEDHELYITEEKPWADGERTPKETDGPPLLVETKAEEKEGEGKGVF